MRYTNQTNFKIVVVLNTWYSKLISTVVYKLNDIRVVQQMCKKPLPIYFKNRTINFEPIESEH